MNCYDPESGLVYRERRFKHRNFVPWEHKCGASRHGMRLKSYRSPQGTDSLLNIVLRKLVSHASTLTPEVLRALPSSYVLMIWRAIQRAFQDSLHVWKVFVNAGYGKEMPLHSAGMRPVYKPLVEYYIDMRSTDYAWLVDLELMNANCSPAEMKSVADLCNLQNLFIGYTGESERHGQIFDDAIVEGLATRAVSEGALKQLRMLFIENANGVSKAVFAFLDKFEALDLFCVLGTQIKRRHRAEATDHGWYTGADSLFESYIRNQKLQLMYNDGAERLSFREFAKSYIQKRRSKDANQLPALTCEYNFDVNIGGTWADQEVWKGAMGFQRDWEFTKQKASHAREIPGDPLEGQPAAKRRKIKAGRMFELDQLLSTH